MEFLVKANVAQDKERVVTELSGRARLDAISRMLGIKGLTATQLAALDHDRISLGDRSCADQSGIHRFTPDEANALRRDARYLAGLPSRTFTDEVRRDLLYNND